ncbi:hypothetical protein VP01_1814g1 [Puccinia sorghi]|uniref:Uncharacterized protein n=1 Tax=Puccinia sorghi TaxID=27349 RepID=A0A0L6VE17_9BASI|nr:hypothetical protein VP01_1814g1 [Puccinia sorghi]
MILDTNLFKIAPTKTHKGQFVELLINLNCKQIKKTNKCPPITIFQLKCTVTANPKFCDKPLLAHPKTYSAMIRDKSFPFFDLEERVYFGKFATGEVSDSKIPPLRIAVGDIKGYKEELGN